MPKLVCYDQFRSDLYRVGIDYAAEHAVALGFDAVECLDSCGSSLPLYAHPEAARFAEVLARNGLSVACYSVAADLFPRTEAVVEELKRHARFAAELGSPFFHHTLQSPLRKAPDAPSFDEVLPVVLESAVEVAQTCGELGMTALYEPQGMYFNGAENLARFFAAISAQVENVGICADFGNPLFVGAEPKEVIARLAQYVRHVHVKDYLRTAAPIAERDGYCLADGHRLYDTMPGDGVVDVPGCLRILRGSGYDGALAFEMSGSDEMLREAITRVKNWWNGYPA